jgi:hypothetical protein
LAAALFAAAVPTVAARAQGADTCAQAQALTLPTTSSSFLLNWDTTQATDDVQLSCSLSEVFQNRPEADVWFTFTPTVSGALTVYPGGAVGIFDSCGGQQLACGGVDSASPFIDRFPVLAGVTYKLAVQADGLDCSGCQGPGASNLIFSPDAPPSNDTCSNALPVSVGTFTFDNRVANTDGVALCAPGSSNDLWFAFTAPASGPFRFRTERSTSGLVYAAVSLHSTCGGPAVACKSSQNGIAPSIDYGMAAGQTVLVRVASLNPAPYPPNVGLGTLVIEATPVPPNDVCANATPVTTGANLVSTLNAFDNNTLPPPCAFQRTSSPPDTWYSYTAPSTGAVNLWLSSPGEAYRPWLTFVNLAIYSSCGGDVLACTSRNGGNPWICALPVQQGHTYLIRIAPDDPQLTSGNAMLNISAPIATPIPNNTTCENAKQVSNGDTAFDTTLACDPSNPQTLYFRYTNTTSTLRSIRARTCGSSFSTYMFAFPDCGSDVITTSNGGSGCSGDPNGSTVRVCLAPGESTIILVAGQNGGYGPGVLNISSNAVAANDTCAGAITLNPGNNTYNTTLGCGIADIPCRSANVQGTTYYREVWYKFTAPYNGHVSMRASNTRGVPVAMTVHQSCGGPSILCADGDLRDDLCIYMNAGETYYVAVSEGINDSAVNALDFGTGTLKLTFSTEVFSVPEIATPEPEACDAPRIDGWCNEGIAIAEILPDQAYFGTQSVFSPDTVYNDVFDGYYFDLQEPGYVRFIGQTEYPSYVLVIDNGGFDTCDGNWVSETDLNGRCVNTFDTGLVYLPVAGRHEVRIGASDFPENWRLCSDNDINYWIQRVCLDCGATCDPDVNQDGNSDQGDVDYLINVVAGGANPTGIDPDFNRDGNVDQGDVDSLLNVVAGGPCP